MKALDDAPSTAMDEPGQFDLLEQIKQDRWCPSRADYAKWATETIARDKMLIERLGLAAE